MSLPMYYAFDGKTEDGCEIQNAYWGKHGGIMVQLWLVKSQAAMQHAAAQDAEATGAAVENNNSTCI